MKNSNKILIVLSLFAFSVILFSQGKQNSSTTDLHNSKFALLTAADSTALLEAFIEREKIIEFYKLVPIISSYLEPSSIDEVVFKDANIVIDSLMPN